MKTFLEYVAEDILGKHGHDLSRTAIVFPNKRAALFLNDYLAIAAKRPIWSPAYITISDLFRHHSTLTVADPIKSICELHKSFTGITGIDESLDRFYGWGQMLLADFDDIDKHMADADHVFANVRDLHELDSVDYLTEEQRAIVKQFFSNFSDQHDSMLRERFIRLWSHLADIYHDFNNRLEQQGLAYEGALYRRVVSDDNVDFIYDRYIFVGFNLLQEVEQHLFRRLHREGRALFYWDFDHYYTHGHEAGQHIVRYRDTFPNELDNGNADIYRMFQEKKKISFLAAPTEDIQARYVSTWLKENGRIDDGRRTAILMCDEKLLPTVVHCLPTEAQQVNITTGYPLSQTPAASLVAQLMALQTIGFRPRSLRTLRRHPYGQLISDEMLRSCKHGDVATTTATMQWLVSLISNVAQSVAKSGHKDDPLEGESLFRTYTLLNRLSQLVESGDLNVDLLTLQRLLNQLIQNTSVPFHGEPAEGIQVMGLLESRNLDFDHVLLLSCNDGNMPRGTNSSSFIPYSLRRAYGLTTADHNNSLYAYHFLHLLQRASDVTIVYNNTADESHTGEMSRFMLQLLVEGGHDIQQKTLQTGQATTAITAAAISKTPSVMSALAARFGKESYKQGSAVISPTAINTYRSCQLKFFYNYLAGLREEDDEEVNIDDRLFGLIFHAAAQYIYEQMMLSGNRIERQQIEMALRSKVLIEQAVDRAFHQEMPELRDYNGLQLINREVIIYYVRRLLELDLHLTPFTILQLETPVVTDIHINNGHVDLTTTIGGTIDRLDSVTDAAGEERIRVIDYKTGGGEMQMLPDMDAVFSSDDYHAGYYLQTMLYSGIVSEDQNLNARHLPVSPALLFIQHASTDDYDPTLRFKDEPISDVAPFLDELKQNISKCLDEIFNPEIDFSPTENLKTCRICPYVKLCGR